MERHRWIGLCVIFSLSLALLARSDTVSFLDGVTVQTVKRQVSMEHHFVESISTISFKATKQTSSFVLCVRSDLKEHEAHFAVYSGTGSEMKGLKKSPLKLDSAPSDVSCDVAEFPEPLKKGGEMEIKVYRTFTKILEPFPAEIAQGEDQKMLYEDNLYELLPYTVAKEEIVVKLPSSTVKQRSEVEKSVQKGSDIEYGPYENVEPFAMKSVELHFVHNNPFLFAKRVVKEVQISLWGNIYVEEVYDMVNGGAKMSGGWSRFDYQKEPMEKSAAACKDYFVSLHPSAHSIYFRDPIGNISSSNVRRNDGYTFVMLRPRFPLFGGWETKFTFGFSLPLEVGLVKTAAGTHRVLSHFGPELQGVIVDEYEFRVVFPEGASNIDFQLPFDVETSMDRKYWYFDTIGRQVLVMKMNNVVARHNVRVRVEYTPEPFGNWRKPTLLATVVFLFFASAMALGRMDWSLQKKLK